MGKASPSDFAIIDFLLVYLFFKSFPVSVCIISCLPLILFFLPVWKHPKYTRYLIDKYVILNLTIVADHFRVRIRNARPSINPMPSKHTRKRERINDVNSSHYILPATPKGSERTLLGPICTQKKSPEISNKKYEFLSFSYRQPYSELPYMALLNKHVAYFISTLWWWKDKYRWFLKYNKRSKSYL